MAKKNHEGEILTRKVFNEGFCWGWNFHFWGGAWPALIETSTVIARLASDCHKHPAEASQDKWVSVAFTFITFLPAPGNKWSTIRKNISLRIFFFFFFALLIGTEIDIELLHEWTFLSKLGVGIYISSPAASLEGATFDPKWVPI